MRERIPHDRSQCPGSRGRCHRRRDCGEDGGRGATSKRPGRQQRARREDAGPWSPARRTGRGAPRAPRCPRRPLGPRRPLRFRPHYPQSAPPRTRSWSSRGARPGKNVRLFGQRARAGPHSRDRRRREPRRRDGGVGATNLGAGHLAQTTRAPFVIGEPEGNTKERTRLLAEVLETVADVRITENISGQVWSKLLVNSAFSGLGAVSGLHYSEVVADPAGREAALAVWREGYDVGAAQGITMDEVLGVPADSLVARGPEDRQQADEALEVAMGYAGATKASMLQDLERGAKTEVDVINGGVVERGTEYSVETPLNARVVELMHAMERGERRPGRDSLEELRVLAG